MRSTLFTLFLLSLEASPGTALRIPLPIQSPSPLLADSASMNDNEKRSFGYGFGPGQKWDLGTELRAQGMNMDKRRKSSKDDTESSDSKSTEHDPDDAPHSRPHKSKPKSSQPDGEDVARVMKANDHNEKDDEGGGRPRKGGKKAKHIPGSHHRDDRHPSNDDSDSQKHHGKDKRPGRKSKHGNEKRYLSSNPRYHIKKELSFWDYDRHVKRMGEFDPLHGIGIREEAAETIAIAKRGHGADERKDKGDVRHSKHGGGGRHAKHGKERQSKDDDERYHRDRGNAGSGLRTNEYIATHHPTGPPIHAMEQGGQVRGDSLPNLHSDTLPIHRQGVTLGDGSVSAKSLASPANHNGASPGGVVPVLSHPKEARGLLDSLRVDDMLGLEYEAYDCEEEIGHGHHTLFGRDDGDQEWQPEPQPDAEPAPASPPAPSPPQQVSVVDGGPRLFADRIIWQPTSDHPEKHGGLERRRKNKHKDDDEEEDGGKHGRNRHNDDEDDYGSKKSKHRDDEEDDSYGFSSGKKGKDRYEDGEEGSEDDYSAKGTGRTKGKGSFDDDIPYSKSNPLSDFDDEDGYSTNTKSRPKSTFDDGQYRPSSYANSGVDDCATLSSFYVSMKGETWSPPVDWSASAVSGRRAGCCTWTGVSCDEYERVIQVDVSSLGLSGPLGSELFSLDALLRLDVSGNALTSLPDRFDTLPTLANINAASNNLTGPIPTTLLTHSTLKTLNLASNTLSGDVVINSVNLTSISLGRNQLASIRIVEGSGLVKVDISDNKFQGLLPDLTLSPDLQIFDASNNNTGTLFDVSRMTSLTRLDVRTNALSGPFPSTLTQLKRLTSLYLSYNAFTGPFPSEPAPPMLASCYVTPNPISPCPSPAELADPNSLASKCHASCPKAPGTGGRAGVAGIPVSPLPGEAGTQPLYLDPTSNSYVLASDTSSQPANVNVNGLAGHPGAVYNQPNQPMNNNMNLPPAVNGPPPYNNIGMDASANSIGGTRQQQMVGPRR